MKQIESEKKMTTNISQAMKEAQQEKIKKVAEIILKYQKFKNSIIVEKMGDCLAKSSKLNYITCGRHYLKTGEKYKNVVGNNFYIYLQNALDKHIQPLTPSFDEKLKITKRDYTKKEAILPITKIINSNKKITTNIEYGIKINDKIILQKNEEMAKAFLNGIKFLNPETEAKVVAVEISNI